VSVAFEAHWEATPLGASGSHVGEALCATGCPKCHTEPKATEAGRKKNTKISVISSYSGLPVPSTDNA
jgi:hypothetical protein